MRRAPLAGAELNDWSALRRVNDGRITKFHDSWFDYGHRIPCYLSETFPALRKAGLITLADPDSSWLARAALTDAGTARYEHLCQKRQKAMLEPAIPVGATGRAVMDQVAILVAIKQVTQPESQLSGPRSVAG